MCTRSQQSSRNAWPASHQAEDWHTIPVNIIVQEEDETSNTEERTGGGVANRWSLPSAFDAWSRIYLDTREPEKELRWEHTDKEEHEMNAR